MLSNFHGLRAEGVVVAGFRVFLCEAAVCRLSSSRASCMEVMGYP